jgi:hypothetical protein
MQFLPCRRKDGTIKPLRPGHFFLAKICGDFDSSCYSNVTVSEGCKIDYSYIPYSIS